MMEEALKEHISQPLATVIGRQLTAAIYHDVCVSEWLTTNCNGIDIISHQLELVFDHSTTIYISWATVKGWMQYSLAVATKSFVHSSESFEASTAYWQKRIGKCLTQLEVYGYLKEELTTIVWDTRQKSAELFYNEPHMLVLHFEDEVVAVTNCYPEEDFQPKMPMGDDVWIMFEADDIAACIKSLKFDNLGISQSAFQ